MNVLNSTAAMIIKGICDQVSFPGDDVAHDVMVWGGVVRRVLVVVVGRGVSVKGARRCNNFTLSQTELHMEWPENLYKPLLKFKVL